ncbi:uncharacterized protein F5891DRAFT_1031406 [Suillus fuscotomentosus]|uniref:N-acetyl-D-glucosamine kinase n=1 Tax=Suillus fuscotomentosus TaxID=1912939 RepID=A0AAD4E838_9AGAM|nr:uncharacterized protein F5891DRAFT_1031406 [Suillus fuscotomentosus]KAG1901051.1 hypothetical protein F5891DRAFT_1031406 [Suillus fuscotomentosus]
MSLFLCVDCGGSKTSAVITDRSGTILGRALGGPSNFAYMSASAFTDAVRVAVSNALKTCVSPPSIDPIPLPPNTEMFASAWFGISGVDSLAAVANASTALSALLGIPLGPRLVVANDTHLLAAPLRLHPDIKHAVAAIGGTGSCVVSFQHQPSGMLSELARTGGWGWILGDEGGGFHVGRETMRQMMYDTARSSLGMEPVLESFGIHGVENAPEVLPVVHLPEPSTAEAAATVPSYLLVAREKRLSQLAPLVFEAAFKDKDPFALNVLKVCAEGLADQIAMLCREPGEGPNLKPRAVEANKAVLCFGGSLVGIEDYRALVREALAKKGHVFRYVEFVDDAAAVGAVGLASLGRT